MATIALVPVEEYLSNTYEPDCDYVDGRLVERNVGEYQHSRLQTLVAAFFVALEDALGILAGIELRVQVRPGRYRVLDLCVIRAPHTGEAIITKPPLVAIELLSPSDKPTELFSKIADYAEFGIPHIWIIDYRKRKTYVADGGPMRESEDCRLSIPSLNLTVDFNDLFGKLDRR